jgi:hypothetical protein
MTIQEKVAKMLCVWAQRNVWLTDDDGNIDLESVRAHFKDGIGQVGRLSDSPAGKNAAAMARLSNRLQKIFSLKKPGWAFPRSFMKSACMVSRLPIPRVIPSRSGRRRRSIPDPRAVAMWMTKSRRVIHLASA